MINEREIIMSETLQSKQNHQGNNSGNMQLLWIAPSPFPEDATKSQIM